jgi:hypothetical protein
MCAATDTLPSTFWSPFTELRKATVGFVMPYVCLPVSMVQFGSLWKDFHEIWYLSILFEYLSRKFKFHSNITGMMGTLHEEIGTFMTGFCWILLTMRNVSDNIVQVVKTHILCQITFFRILCHLSENVQKYGTAWQTTDDNKIRCVHFACWLTKVTSTKSVNVILIAWQREKWLGERGSMFTLICALPLLSVLC